MFVKVCGTTSEEDALLAVAMGADAVGFIFAPSPRQVSVAAVRAIVGRLPREVVTVGVFRDEAPEQVVTVVNGLGLGAAQLHGHETPSQVQWIAERVRAVINAFPAGSSAIGRAAEYGAHVVMLDAPSPGSGQVFDWTLVEGVPPGSRLLLAGGLTPDNVADAIAQAKPWGVDVCTGVEASPGRKDAVKLRAFVAAAKATDPRPEESGGEGPFDWQATD